MYSASYFILFFFCLEFSHRCPKCDFCTKSEPEWKLHLKEDHNLTPEDLDDDQGIRAPKINSQGKVKVFKCKQVRNLHICLKKIGPVYHYDLC